MKIAKIFTGWRGNIALGAGRGRGRWRERELYRRGIDLVPIGATLHRHANVQCACNGCDSSRTSSKNLVQDAPSATLATDRGRHVRERRPKGSEFTLVFAMEANERPPPHGEPPAKKARKDVPTKQLQLGHFFSHQSVEAARTANPSPSPSTPQFVCPCELSSSSTASIILLIYLLY